MPSNGEIEIEWINGSDKFNIARLEFLLALEDKAKMGFAEILLRLENGTWNIQSVRETIRLGLIGGGKTEIIAESIVRRWVDSGARLAHCAQVAHAIIRTMMIGVEGENDIGKKKDEAKSNNDQPASPPSETMDGSDAPPFMDGARQSASLRETLTE